MKIKGLSKHSAESGMTGQIVCAGIKHLMSSRKYGKPRKYEKEVYIYDFGYYKTCVVVVFISYIWLINAKTENARGFPRFRLMCKIVSVV